MIEGKMRKLFALLVWGGMIMWNVIGHPAEIPQKIMTDEGVILDVSGLIGHTHWHNYYSTTTSNLKILDPPAGQKIRIIFVVASTGSGADVKLWFGQDTSSKPFFLLKNTLTTGVAQGQSYALSGTIDDDVYLTCPADTLVVIYYDFL